MVLINDDHHADAIVEGAIHFDVIDAGCFLKPCEQLRLGPAAFLQMCGHAFRQDPGNVLKQTTACDVSQGFDGVNRQGMKHRLHVQPGGSHDGLLERLAIQGERQLVGCTFDAFANQAEAIGMHTMRAKSQHNIASLNILARQNFRFFYSANCKSS